MKMTLEMHDEKYFSETPLDSITCTEALEKFMRLLVCAGYSYEGTRDCIINMADKIEFEREEEREEERKKKDK